MLFLLYNNFQAQIQGVVSTYHNLTEEVMQRFLHITVLIAVLLFSLACNSTGTVAPTSADGPSAHFTSTAPGGYVVDEYVIFDPSTSTSPLFDIIEFIWDWDDGTPGESRSDPSEVTHIFTAPDVYTITLTVRDKAGFNASASQEITIVLPGEAPTACFDFDSPDGWQPGSVLNFDASSSTDPDSDPLTYTWDWDNGETSEASDSPFTTHSWDSEGTYEVRLTVRDTSDRESISTPSVISIGRPLSPHVVSSFPAESGVNDIVLRGDYAFIVSDKYKLKMIDISDPFNPKPAEWPPQTGNGYHLVIDGNFAYVAELNGALFGAAYGFAIYDLSDPQNPVLASVLETSNTSCLTVSDGYCFLPGDWPPDSWTENALLVIDVSNPYSPEVVGFDYYCCGNAIAVVGDRVYLNNYNSTTDAMVHIFDVSQPSAPFDTGFLSIPATVNSMASDAGHLFSIVTYPDDGPSALQVYNTDDPDHPKFISETFTGGTASDMVILGDYAYIADDHDDLLVIDLQDLNNPEVVSSQDVPLHAEIIGIYGDTAFVYSGGTLGHNWTYSIIQLW